MTQTDIWRRLAVETPEGSTLLFDPWGCRRGNREGKLR